MTSKPNYIIRNVESIPVGIAILLLTLSLAACSLIPIYQAPSDTSNSAHISLSFTDQSFLAGVVTIAQIEGEIICGETLPNYKKMIRISKGNPLISNINPTGTYIPAGQKFTFAATGLNDGHRGCGHIFSLVPKVGSRYEINVTNIHNLNLPETCPIQVNEVTQNTNGTEKTLSPTEVTYERCRPRN